MDPDVVGVVPDRALEVDGSALRSDEGQVEDDEASENRRIPSASQSTTNVGKSSAVSKSCRFHCWRVLWERSPQRAGAATVAAATVDVPGEEMYSCR